jgi:hypothetical protein
MRTAGTVNEYMANLQLVVVTATPVGKTPSFEV